MSIAAQLMQTIEKGRVIAILRGDFRGNECLLADSLMAGGITAMEVTLNSANAFEVIRNLVKHPKGNAVIGAGTVLTVEEVKRVAGIGGQFIVSPNRDVAVIEATKKLGLSSFPGCFTPTEICEAKLAGADAIKLFPASSMGIGYLKALMGPLPDLKYVPTGGVTPALAREYTASGAWAVGVGSELISKDFFQHKDVAMALAKIEAQAASYREALVLCQ
jgi:2-dehydro-3-deoxyphosphogluconate aldolase / (4S)-4-hydroxy-2-oxoglutarate aldolase